jgi:hypothetical protein
MAATRVKGGGVSGERRRAVTLSYGTAAALGHSGRVGESLGRSGGEEEEEERMVYRAVERKPWSRCILTSDA